MDEPVGEDVWRKFLADTERAILASAPREPAAAERGRGRTTAPPPPPVPPPPSRAPYADTVGEPWQPEEPRSRPAWGELDRGGRLRRAGRVAGTAAAVALALTAWSQWAGGPVAPVEGPADTIGRPLEETPFGLPPEASPPASTAPAAPAASAVPVAPAASVAPAVPVATGAPDAPASAGPALYAPSGTPGG
ncbi:hypothetical protein [Streptomyces sp. SID8352]|uniref:hypothetical protein n=1 Tax=Streptomyces sp. SID8352 TaxID=2690338 RepID=UPI001371DBE4|nr:hypothetical protein [Streptomyces sp. SID8352]